MMFGSTNLIHVVSGAAVRSDWDPTAAGVLLLPSGRLVRGRALRRPLPEGPPPDFGLYLLGREPEWVPWRSRWSAACCLRRAGGPAINGWKWPAGVVAAGPGPRSPVLPSSTA
jgi:hypothetical protein